MTLTSNSSVSNRKVILYIAMSLDGFIATQDNDLSFLSDMEQEGQDYGYGDFIKTVDTVIIGRKTYDHVLSMGFDYPHTDKEVYIVTRTPRKSFGSFHFYTGELPALVTELKQKQGLHIYCDGGAEIVNELQRFQLIDEYIVSVIPVLLGDGTRLFKTGQQEQKLQLVSSKSFEKGLVQLHYQSIK